MQIVRTQTAPWVAPFDPDRPEGRLCVQTLRPYRLRVLLRAGVDAGQRCVAAGPGAVAVALLLAELVGPTGEVLALDPSEAAIEAGEALAAAGGWENVELENVPLGGERGVPIPKIACDLLYVVNLLAVSADLDAAVAMVAEAVPTGTQVILEEQDLEGGAAGSAAPVLHRWQELRRELARRNGGHADGAGRASSLLVHHGFRVEEVEVGQPAFVHGGGSRVPVAELESTRPALLEAGLLTEADAEELWRQLDDETSVPGQLVFWPRVVFVRAVL